MYLRELYSINEDFVVKQNGSEWNVIDTDNSNRVMGTFGDKDSADVKSSELTNKSLSNRQGSNKNNNSTDNSPPKPKRKVGKPRVEYLSKDQYKITLPDGKSFQGPPSKMVDQLIAYEQTVNPKRAARITAHRRKYISHVKSVIRSSNRSRVLSSFFKIIGSGTIKLCGVAASSVQLIDVILNEATELEVLRQYGGAQAVTDPEGKGIKYMLDQAVGLWTADLVAFFVAGKVLKNIKRLLAIKNAVAAGAGPAGWAFIIITELVTQGAIMFATRMVQKHNDAIIGYFASDWMIDQIRNLRNLYTGYNLGVQDDEDENDSTESIANGIAQNRTGVEQSAREAAADGSIPPAEVPLIRRALSNAEKQYILTGSK